MSAPLVCHGHSRPIVNLEYSQITDDGVFLISSSKGAPHVVIVIPRGCLAGLAGGLVGEAPTLKTK